MSTRNGKNNLQSSEETAQALKSLKYVNKVKASPETNFEKGVLKLKSLNFELIESKRDVFYEIKEVIQSILNEVNKTIQIKKGYYNLSVSQTLGAIFNEPQIMFNNFNITSREEQPSKLVFQEEPKAKAYIDGSIGCVKIENVDKNVSVCSGRSKNKRLTNRSSRRMSRSGMPEYGRSPRNSIKLRTMESLNLESIEEKKSNFSLSKSINISVSDFIQKDLEETTDGEKNKTTVTNFNNNKRKSMSSGEFLSLMRALSKPSKFNAIITENNDKDDEDHFINYLRYVKEDNQSTGSNVISFILDSLKPKEFNREGGKRKSIVNYKLPKIDNLEEKEWMQGPDKTYETIKCEETFLLAKKEKKMSVRVSLLNKEQINKDMNSVKDKFVLINTQVKQERRLSKVQNKENFDLMKQLEINQELNKTQEESQSVMYKKDESLAAKRNEKEIVRFPSLNTRRHSKELFHPICIDESLIWLKGKEDQKEYEEKMNEFMGKNSEKCTLRVNYNEKTEGVNQAKEKLASINIPEQLNNPRKSRISRLSLLIAR